MVWTREPLKRLKTLAILVDACKRGCGVWCYVCGMACYCIGLRGGALVSKLFTFTQHGDPEVKKTVQHILNQVHTHTHTHHYMNIESFSGVSSYQFFTELVDL